MRGELQPLPLILTPLVFLGLKFLYYHLFILFRSNSFLCTWFWVSNWSFWNCGSFDSQELSLVLPEKSMDKIWSEQILHVYQTFKQLRVVQLRQELSNWGKSCPKRNVDSKRHCCFEKCRWSGNISSSQIVKVKITKNVPKSFVTIVTVFV